MKTTLYSISSSHPGYAAHLMLAHKRLGHSVVELPPGLHGPSLRALGFPGGTVPALILAGRRVQGSRQISRALEEVRTDPALFPARTEERVRVEQAELWGESELQPVPRRLFRWLMTRRRDARALIFQRAGLPAAGPLALVSRPIAHYYAGKVDATDDRKIAELITTLPSLLGRVDAMLADGTIGGDRRNAADFQIATTVRLLLAFEDLEPIVRAHRAAGYASAMLPCYPFAVPAGFVPASWLRT